MKKLVALLVVLCPLGVSAQNTVGAVVHPLNEHDTDDLTAQITFANGPRLIAANGGIWFLESNADRIAFFKNDTITEWPIRSHAYVDPYRSIGANPADFEVDGTDIWFIENGTSGIDIQQSVFAKLDTVTNVMTEWILPVSKPAAFVREPDGTVWIAISQGSLLHVDLNTLAVVAYRGPNSFAYSGMVAGADGMFYLSDFGNNRIVRIDPRTLSETGWQPFLPANTQSEPTQPTLDGAGNVFVAEDVAGGAIARLNLATGDYDQFGIGFLLNPTHFFLQGDFIYAVETDTSGGDGRFVVIDTKTAPDTKISTVPVQSTLVALSQPAALVRTFTLTPDTFQSADDPPDALIAASSPTTGVSRFTLPSGTVLISSTSYSIAPINGKIVSGVRGALVEFTLLPAANPTDLVIPLALNSANGLIKTDFTLFDAKKPTASWIVSFFATPVPPAPSSSFSVGTGVTLTVPDALGKAELNAGDGLGSVLFALPVADAPNDQAETRTYAIRPDGGTYGFALTAASVSSGLSSGSSGALFLQTQPGETSIFGIYSPTGAVGTATLHSPSGAIRGGYSFFLPENNRQEFNPAFSAFGVAAEAGDTITFDLSSGNLFPYATLYQQTGDVAVATPSSLGSDFVVPAAGSSPTTTGTVVSDLIFANPDAQDTATVAVAFFPANPAIAPTASTVSVPPGGTAIVPYENPAQGFGSLIVKSSSPVYALARFANRTEAGDFATAAQPLLVPSNTGRFLVSADVRLRRNLFVFNRGTAATLTLRALDANGGVVAVVEVPIGDHRPAFFPNFGTLVGSGGGRIEYSGSAGSALYAWLAAGDPITGDWDDQAPLPISP